MPLNSPDITLVTVPTQEQHSKTPWMKKDAANQHRQEKQIINETSAYHAIFTLPKDSESVNFTYLNQTLKQILDLNSQNEADIPLFLKQKLKTIVTSNDWEKEPNPSFISSLHDSDPKNNFYGLTVEKIGENKFHLTGRNITDKQIIRQQTEYKLTHDPQTGYLNSIGWAKETEAINNEKRGNQKPKTISIFYFDLAGVKEVNDTFGHVKGDEYIRQSFRRITKYFKRTDDIISRINNTGDELVVCLQDIDAEDVNRLSQKLDLERKKDSPKPFFYFGSASALPDSFGNFNFSDIMNQADIQQNKDKNLIKHS